MTTPYMSFDDIDDGPRHDQEVLAAHGCVPSPEAAVNRGVTPASGGDDYSLGGMP